MPRVYRATPLHPAFHRRIGSIPINLERPDPGAIKRVLRALDAGRVIGIFPEGPFSQEGRLVPGQPGVAMIALRAGVPVVPAAIEGTYEALRARRFYLPRRHPLSVRFGAPLAFGRPRLRPIARPEREEITRRIMSEIAALLATASEPAATVGRAGAS
jgi:1-acyl-sn-glycerol-3-phosphate acyltransferase